VASTKFNSRARLPETIRPSDTSAGNFWSGKSRSVVTIEENLSKVSAIISWTSFFSASEAGRAGLSRSFRAPLLKVRVERPRILERPS